MALSIPFNKLIFWISFYLSLQSNYHISRKKTNFIIWDPETKANSVCILLTGRSSCVSLYQKVRLSLYPNDPFVCHYVKKIQMSMSLSVTSKPDTKKKPTFVLFSIIEVYWYFQITKHEHSVLISWYPKGSVDKKDAVCSGGPKFRNTSLFLNSDGTCSFRKISDFVFSCFIIYLSGV